MLCYTSVGRKFRAICSDGVTRTVQTTAEPDTYFSQSARVQIKGKTVTGMLTHDSYSDSYYFDAYTYCKNASLLPSRLSRNY